MVLSVICLIFFGLALIGMPLVWSLLATTAGTIWIFGRFYPLKAVFLTFIDGVQPLHLAAIPLFVLAGNLISHGGVSDELYEETRQHFSEQELVDLNWAVTAINTWNRIAISFRMVPGNYRSPHAKAKSPEPQPA